MSFFHSIPDITDLKSFIEWCEAHALYCSEDDMMIYLPPDEYHRLDVIFTGGYSRQTQFVAATTIGGVFHGFNCRPDSYRTTVYLRFIEQASTVCTCEKAVWMNHGCKCGAFKKEQEDKKQAKQEDTIKILSYQDFS